MQILFAHFVAKDPYMEGTKFLMVVVVSAQSMVMGQNVDLA